MSFFRYPGGKAKIRKDIINSLVSKLDTSHIQYREPFFGGGSIGLNFLELNTHINNFWINDKDVGITCLWLSVLNYPEELINQVKFFKPSTEFFYTTKKELLNLKEIPKTKNKIVDIGFKKIAIHQISYSGLGTKSGGPLGGEKQLSKYKINCRWSPDYISKKILKLNTLFADKIIKCTNFNFESIITDESCPSLLYVDPPYYEKGEDLYQHSLNESEHKHLAELLKNTTHTWVLSYDDCEIIRDYYSWATVKTIDIMYSITSTKDTKTAKRLSRKKQELIIYK
jgi:DNA adenine methylase